MRIEADALIEHPRSRVYRAYRDEMPRLVGALPRIRKIEVESRTDAPPIVELVNVWYGAAKIPAVAAKILPPVLSWHDFARWDDSEWICHWKLRSHAFPEAVRCEGTNRFFDEGGRTRVEIQGEIKIDLSRVPMVPELIATPVSNTVERFFVRQITPNLLTVSDALGEYLSSLAAHPGG